MVAINAYKINQPVWLTWPRTFLWTSLVYLGGALAASLTFWSINAAGFNAFIATASMIAIIERAYRMYLNNAEAVEPPATGRGAGINDDSERFRSAFDHAAIGMALVSSEGRWLQVNRSLCDILGYTERELMGMDFLTVTNPDDIGAAPPLIPPRS